MTENLKEIANLLIQGIENRETKLDKIRALCEQKADATAKEVLKILDGKI